MSYMETYKEWCTNPYFDENTKAELAAIGDDAAEIEDRFYRQLEFGTGGLRGVIGAGTNRMNIYTVRQATQGLANYILSQNGQEKGVAIAHDSRIMSTEFADMSRPPPHTPARTGRMPAPRRRSSPQASPTGRYSARR